MHRQLQAKQQCCGLPGVASGQDLSTESTMLHAEHCAAFCGCQQP